MKPITTYPTNRNRCRWCCYHGCTTKSQPNLQKRKPKSRPKIGKGRGVQMKGGVGGVTIVIVSVVITPIGAIVAMAKNACEREREIGVK